MDPRGLLPLACSTGARSAMRDAPRHHAEASWGRPVKPKRVSKWGPFKNHISTIWRVPPEFSETTVDSSGVGIVVYPYNKKDCCISGIVDELP